jgi:hypothetical protein
MKPCRAFAPDGGSSWHVGEGAGYGPPGQTVPRIRGNLAGGENRPFRDVP